MNRHGLRVRDYLGHMLDAVNQMRTYTNGKSLQDLYADRLLQDAVIRNLEILGEASRRLLETDPDAALHLPGIPFTAIYAMRNQLSHGYFAVDLDVVWNVVIRDIPDLRSQLQAAIAQFTSNPNPQA
jgi:uncharacterized protein with HEPN domain